MFLMALCILIGVLLTTGHTPDAAGWMMLVGGAWLAGYLDCRFFARSDQDTDRVLPPDAAEPFDDDATTFQS